MSWTRLALRRAREAPTVPLSVVAVMAVVASVLSLVATGGAAAVSSGVHEALASASPVRRSVQVSVRRDPQQAETQDDLVRAALDTALAGSGGVIHPSMRSELLPLASGGRTASATQARLVAWTAPDLREHALLVAGAWPDPARLASPLPAALHAGAAQLLGVRVGDVLGVAGPDRGDPVLAVLVVGLWRPRDDADPYWFADPLELTGIERPTVLGPLVVTEPVVRADLVPHTRWTAAWRSSPDPGLVGPSDLGPLVARLAALPDALATVPTGGGAAPAVDGGLADLLTAQRHPVAVTGAATAVLIALLTGLAALLALLTASLVATLRAGDTLVLRARGASRRQRATATVLEALALAALAAGPAAAAVAMVGPVVSDARARAGVAATAGFAAVTGVVVGLATEALTTGASAGERRRGAPARRSGVLAVVATCGGLAVWQLRRTGSAGPLTAADTLDPLLALAPAVLLLAGAVLVVQGIAYAGRPLERVARRGGAVPAMSGWQLSRRGARPAAPVVGVVLAAAFGCIAIVSAGSAMSTVSERSAAAFGTDLVVDQPSSTAAPALATSSLSALTGATSVTPVMRLDAAVGGRAVPLLAVDATRLADVTASAGQAAITREAAAVLTGSTPIGSDVLPAMAPGDQLRVTLTAGTTTQPLPADRPVEVAAPASGIGPVDVTVLLSGPDRVQLSVPLPSISADAAWHDVAAALPAGSAVTPLHLVGFDVSFPGRSAPGTLVVLQVRTLGVGPAGAGAVTPPAPGSWQSTPLEFPAPAPGSVVGLPDRVPGLLVEVGFPVLAESVYGARVIARPGGARVSLDRVASVLVTRELAASLDLRVGSQIVIQRLGAPIPMTVGGVVGRVPGVGPGPAALVDIGVLERARLLSGASLLAAHEWWVGGRVEPGAAQAALSAAGAEVRVQSLRQRTAQAASDPLVGTIRRLLAVAVLACLLVAAGAIALGNAVSARARTGELAVLRAIGFSRAQMSAVVAAEQASVTGIAVVAGLAMGLLVSPVIVPSLAAPAVADGVLRVTVPWWPVLGFLACLTAIVAVAALLRAVRAPHLDIAGVLRRDGR